ncbi:MAG: hypothetical protein RIQ93_2144 [Verrucomicrobiota bacterium]|jgi:hypothetical protein
MAALTHALEYAAVREAIQQLTTLDSSGGRRDTVSFTLGDMSYTYSQAQMQWLEKREETLARRLTQRNIRKRVTPDFGGTSDYLSA